MTNPTSNQRVRLLIDIYDDGADHHPPGYIARKGEVLVARTVRSLGVSHEGVENRQFVVREGEFEVIQPVETTGCQHCETLKARVKLLEGETSRMFGELFQIAAERRNSSPEEPSCTCGFPNLPCGTAHRRDCALYDGSSLEPPEQLYRLRPLCICDNALTSQNPACPIHGSSENGEASQA